MSNSTFTAIGGLNGHGKTHKCVAMAYKEFKKTFKSYSNFRIASNIKLTNIEHSDRVVRYKSLKEIVFLTNAVVIIDEIQDQVDNRDFQNTPKMIIKFFEQHRHNNLKIFCTTQVFRKVDIKIRELIQEAWQVRKVLGKEKEYCLYRSFKLDAGKLPQMTEMDRIPLAFGGNIPRYTWVHKNQKSLYNTWEDSSLIPFKCDIWLKPKRKNSKKIIAEIRSTY